MFDTGYWVFDAGCWISDGGVFVTGCRMRIAGAVAGLPGYLGERLCEAGGTPLRRCTFPPAEANYGAGGVVCFGNGGHKYQQGVWFASATEDTNISKACCCLAKTNNPKDDPGYQQGVLLPRKDERSE